MTASEPSGTRRYEAAPHVVFEEMGTEVVLLDTQSGKFLGLNSTGQIIWRGLQTGASVDELATQLSALEDAPKDIRGHIDQFLADLEQRSLIRRVGSDITD
jgi:coenzyme PQQ synthesis protein D (PqqD)